MVKNEDHKCGVFFSPQKIASGLLPLKPSETLTPENRFPSSILVLKPLLLLSVLMKTHLPVHIPTLPDMPWPSRGPSLSFKTLHLTAELRVKLYPIIMSLCTQVAMQNFCTIRILVITWFPVAGQSSHYVSMDPSSLLKKTIYVLIFRCSCG